MNEVAVAQQIDCRLSELRKQTSTGSVPWCYDCKCDLRNLAYGGYILLGCGRCWERNGYCGPPPQNAALYKGGLCPRKLEQKADPGLRELLHPPKTVQKSSSASLIRRKTVDGLVTESRRSSREERTLAMDNKKSLPCIPLQKSSQFLDVNSEDSYVRDDERAKVVFGKLAKKPLQDTLNTLVQHLHAQDLTEEQLFQRIDANGDGQLSREEMRVALRKMGCVLLPAHLDAILRAFDSDGNGTIDFLEFTSLLRSHAASMASKQELVQSPQDLVSNILGFDVGSRVRKAIMLPRAEKSDAYDPFSGTKFSAEADTEGIVIGEGETNGTIKCNFNGNILNLKPNQIVHVNIQNMVKRSKSFAHVNRRMTL